MKNHFRIGHCGKQLERDEFSPAYSEIGGEACIPPDFPSIQCSVCQKEMRLLFQFISNNASKDVTRTVYVFLCDSKHYYLSAKVICYQHKIDESEPPKQAMASDTNIDDLLLLVENMGGEAKIESPQKEYILENNDFPGYDAFSEEIEDLPEQLALNKSNYVDVLPQICESIYYLISETHLCEQRCITELKKGHFLEQDIAEQQDEVSHSQEEEEETKEEAELPEADLHECECDECKQFRGKYVHEFDLFGTFIWKLKLKHAEFKCIYVFCPRNDELGYQDGVFVCMKDEDDVSKLLNNKK